jgi:large conductance mechanosensitive channel
VKKLTDDFRGFITTGNLIAIAIGILMGVKIGEVVAAFTKYLFTPIFALIGGKPSLDGHLVLTINKAHFEFGSFLTVVFDFVITAFVAFLILKAATKLFPPKEAGTAEEIQLLREIRDSLQK